MPIFLRVEDGELIAKATTALEGLDFQVRRKAIKAATLKAASIGAKEMRNLAKVTMGTTPSTGSGDHRTPGQAVSKAIGHTASIIDQFTALGKFGVHVGGAGGKVPHAHLLVYGTASEGKADRPHPLNASGHSGRIEPLGFNLARRAGLSKISQMQTEYVKALRKAIRSVQI